MYKTTKINDKTTRQEQNEWEEEEQSKLSTCKRKNKEGNRNVK